MNKVLKIVMWTLVLAVLYIWLSSIFKSCGNKVDNLNDDIVDGTEEIIDDVGDGVEEIIDGTEELFEDEEDGIDYSDDEDYDTQEEIVEEIIEEEEVDPTPPARYTKNTSTSSSVVSSSGSYMLIAGNYLVESNANSMKQKLQNLGYGSAEIAVFDNSPYHTVIAQRYTDYSRAVNASSNLKDKGVDCYVKKRT